MSARPIITIDCETDPFKYGRAVAPFLWGTYSKGDGFRHFDDAAEMMKTIIGRDCMVYAHNGGNFDFLFLAEFFEPRKRVRIINNRLSEFKIGRATFRDSFLIFPMGLGQYKKDEISYDIFERGERDKPKNRSLILKYLEGDVRYLHELVTKFRGEYGGNLTLASAALKYWKQTSGNDLPSTTPAFYSFFKPYYHGGRVSVFKSGIFKGGNYKCYDINSAYPWAMNQKQPWGDGYATLSSLPRESKIPQCFIDCRARSVGAFPFTDDKKLDFPNDGAIRDFHITGWEYLSALRSGTLKDFELQRVHMFHETIDFKEYVAHFFERKAAAKAEGDTYKEQTAKLFLNSPYGKMASDGGRYRDYILVKPGDVPLIEKGNDPEYEGYTFDGFFGRLCLMSRPVAEGNRRYYNVATAAAITGCVRGFLWESICRSEVPYYCDTDSIIMEGEFSGTVGAKLGQWKLEKEGNKLAIAGKKLYALFPSDGGKVKTASKGARLTPSEIERVAGGETVEFFKNSPLFSIKTGGIQKFQSRHLKKTVK